VDWQKGLESQVTHLNDKLSALCSKMKELHLLLLVDDEDRKLPNFKHDQLGFGVKETSIVLKKCTFLNYKLSPLIQLKKWLPHLKRLHFKSP
jgi:hypothetical protein